MSRQRRRPSATYRPRGRGAESRRQLALGASTRTRHEHLSPDARCSLHGFSALERRRLFSARWDASNPLSGLSCDHITAAGFEGQGFKEVWLLIDGRPSNRDPCIVSDTRSVAIGGVFGRAVETLDDFANGVPQQLRSLRLGDHTFCQRANAQAFETGWPFVRQRVRLAPPPFLDAKDLEHTGEGRLTDDAQVLAAIRDRLRPLGLAVGLIDVLSRDSDTTA
jgi:hypothetical protein